MPIPEDPGSKCHDRTGGAYNPLLVPYNSTSVYMHVLDGQLGTVVEVLAVFNSAESQRLFKCNYSQSFHSCSKEVEEVMHKDCK